jgi:hypothetical protein
MKYVSIVMVTVLFIGLDPTAHADWIHINGPYGGNVSCLAVSPNGSGGTNLIAGTGSGVFLSTNNGTSAGRDVWACDVPAFSVQSAHQWEMVSTLPYELETEEQRSVSPTCHVPSSALPHAV